MIKGTAANCKIKSITISEFEATIICVIYSSAPAVQHKPFQFLIRDKDKSLTIVSENIYWIDRLNNYNNDSKNIDVNQYAEVILKVDITNSNTSPIIDNKWVRDCNLILKDLSVIGEQLAWISEDLHLVSKEFEIPKVYDLDIYSDKNYNLFIKFQYKYSSQQDFNYNNKNLYTTINIVSLYTDTVLETKDVEEENSYISLVSTQMNGTYNSPIKVQIILKNYRGDSLFKLERIYNPTPRVTNSFIKTETGIKRVLAYYVKPQDISDTKGG